MVSGKRGLDKVSGNSHLWAKSVSFEQHSTDAPAIASIKTPTSAPSPTVSIPHQDDLSDRGPVPISEERRNTGSGEEKIAYITIDDGNIEKNMLRHLDTLQKYNVKATFFVLPSTSGSVLERIVKEGHVLGNHSSTHNYDNLYQSVDGFKKDVLKAENFFKDNYKSNSKIFRFPGGSAGKEPIFKYTIQEMGYKFFDWNVTAADTDPKLKNYGTEEEIVNLLTSNVLKGAKNLKRAVILMHDTDYTVKALPEIIKGLMEQGFTFDVLTNY